MLQSVFEKALTTSWTKILDFGSDLGRKSNINEGFEVYSEDGIAIEFGIGTATEEPEVVFFTLQKQLLWKYIQGKPTRGVLYARAKSGTPTVQVEV